MIDDDTKPLYYNDLKTEVISCRNCEHPIVFHTLKNNYLGIHKIIEDNTDVYDIIKSYNDQHEALKNNIRSQHKRAENLYKRCQMYHSLLSQYAMTTGNNMLLVELEKIEKGYI